MNWQTVLLLVGSYILGSIPFGVLIARAQAGVDITTKGSGNIGATNVHRVLGWKASVPVMLLDICKGLLPALIARGMNLSWAPYLSVIDVALIAGFAAVLGHCTSPFLKFKGGKGIATICGAAIGATPAIAIIGIAVFVLATAITRYISVGSILAVLAATTTAIALHFDNLVIAAFAAISLFIIYKHRSNIQRLARGEESKFKLRGGASKTKDEPSDPAKEQKDPVNDSGDEKEHD